MNIYIFQFHWQGSSCLLLNIQTENGNLGLLLIKQTSPQQMQEFLQGKATAMGVFISHGSLREFNAKYM